jgi:hypothetical protein
MPREKQLFVFMVDKFLIMYYAMGELDPHDYSPGGKALEY